MKFPKWCTRMAAVAFWCRTLCSWRCAVCPCSTWSWCSASSIRRACSLCGRRFVPFSKVNTLCLSAKSLELEQQVNNSKYYKYTPSIFLFLTSVNIFQIENFFFLQKRVLKTTETSFRIILIILFLNLDKSLIFLFF